MNYNDDHFRSMNEYRGMYLVKIKVHGRPLTRVSTLTKKFQTEYDVYSFLKLPHSVPTYGQYTLDVTLMFGTAPGTVNELEIITLGHNIDWNVLKSCANRLGVLFLTDPLE